MNLALLTGRLRSAFGRKTSDGVFLPIVDGLRFVAIAWVFLYHSAGYTVKKIHGSDCKVYDVPFDVTQEIVSSYTRVASVGFFGVQLFFVLSGFILALPFARARLLPSNPRRDPSIRAFYIRRITRLEPPYLINLFACAILIFLFKGRDLFDLAASTLVSVFYGHSLIMPGKDLLNGVTWSLEIEVQFYLLVPLFGSVFFLSNLRLRRLILFLSITLCCIVQSLWMSHIAHGLNLGNQLQYFLTGFLLADAYLLDWQNQTRSYKWDAVGIGASVALVFLLLVNVNDTVATHGFAMHLACCACIYLAYAGAFRGRMLSRLLSLAPIYLIGGACYTIYLWHILVISFVGGLVGASVSSGSMCADTLIYSAVFAMASLPIMAVLFVTTERPFMDKAWPSRFLSTICRVLGRKRSSCVSNPNAL
jgi:peptidoglycan/LPS O-acetylase OafA/YrhL